MIAAFETDDDVERPVYLRASFTAFSTASAPLLASSVFFGKVAGRDFVQQFRQLDVRLIGGDQRAGMNELVCLLLDRFDYGLRRVAHGEHADAAGQIDERVAVDVEHERTVGALDHHVGGSAQSGWNCGSAPRQNFLRFGAGNFGVQSNIRHRMLLGCAA